MVYFSKQHTQHPTAHAERLADEIAVLAAQLHAATYRLLVCLREFDACNGWGPGFASCAHWLSWRTGIAPGAAREKVRVARALAALPLISDAMRRGSLSFAKARALTRVATPDNEAQLLDVANHASAAQVERIIRAWRRVDSLEAQDRERERHETRSLTWYIDDDGSFVIHGRLPADAGALFQRALERAADQLRARDRSASRASSADQKYADALTLVCEQALASTDGGGRYQVVLHVEAEQAVLETGARVSAETSRRLSCDASRVTMTHDAAGNTLDVGRRSRTVPPAIRRALEHRDRGCRFPGCRVRYCDAHHIKHWSDGGATRLSNLVLLCRRHHRCVHEDGFRVELHDGGDVRFFDPRGRAIDHAPPLPAAVQPMASDHGIDAGTIAGNWLGHRLDLAFTLRTLRPQGHDVSAETPP